MLEAKISSVNIVTNKVNKMLQLELVFLQKIEGKATTNSMKTISSLKLGIATETWLYLDVFV